MCRSSIFFRITGQHGNLRLCVDLADDGGRGTRVTRLWKVTWLSLQARRRSSYLVERLVAGIRLSFCNAPAEVTPPAFVISPMYVSRELVALRVITREVGDTKDDAAFAVLRSIVCFDGVSVCVPEYRQQNPLIMLLTV